MWSWMGILLLSSRLTVQQHCQNDLKLPHERPWRDGFVPASIQGGFRAFFSIEKVHP
jgi:hypothetical protein